MTRLLLIIFAHKETRLSSSEAATLSQLTRSRQSNKTAIHYPGRTCPLGLRLRSSASLWYHSPFSEVSVHIVYLSDI
jgi:hypothetical protein